MVVRMFWGKLKPESWDAYERHYNERVVPATAKLPGFRGRQLLRSLENPDEGTSLTFWETMEDMENYVKSPEWQKAAGQARDLYTGEYSIHTYEVRALSLLSLGNV